MSGLYLGIKTQNPVVGITSANPGTANAMLAAQQMAQAQQEAASADPYAWAKARQEPVGIPAAAVATTPVAAQTVAAAVQPAATQASQHPGWIWDSVSNNWVPDPNYTPDQ